MNYWLDTKSIDGRNTFVFRKKWDMYLYIDGKDGKSERIVLLFPLIIQLLLLLLVVIVTPVVSII